jgi:predicted branched-subunit amino acid permease
MNLSIAGQTEREKIAFWDAMRVSMSAAPGLAAWGVVTGMAMIQSGLSLWQALIMSFTVYAGSAQLAALPLIAAGTPISMIFLTALMVNLRFIIFGVVIGPHFSHLPWARRIFKGYFNADVVMAFFPQRFPAHTVAATEGKLGFFNGLAASNWSSWQLGSVVGMLLASQIPTSWGIGFAGTLALLAITIPLVINWAALVGVAVAGTISVLTIAWPFRLGLVLAILLGMVAAMSIDRLQRKQSA